MLRIGMIGLGVMGSAMSTHLLAAGFPVTGFDVDGAALDRHGESGGTAAGSAAEVATGCDVVVTSLPDRKAFRKVIREIATAGAAPGLIVADTSTLPLDPKLRARDALAGAGIVMLDCPVSGSGAQARTRDLVAYVSGDDGAAKERVGPVLDAFARARHDAGPFGNGTRLKIVANLLVAAHTVAAAEALLLARAAGLDPALTLRAVGDGAGSSRMFQVRGPMMVAGDFDEATMRLGLFAEDLETIAAFAQNVRSPTPVFDASAAVYRAALAEGRGHQDPACVHEVLGRMPDDSGNADQGRAVP
jgi:putative dehydrogenase